MDPEVIDLLFEQVFSLRHGRRPQHWEAVLGHALVTGELIVKRAPAAPELSRIHNAAADVALALRGSL